MKAYAYRSGQVYIGGRVPMGCVEIADAYEELLEVALHRAARRSPDGRIFIVPGLPSAPTEGEAIVALTEFAKDFLQELSCAEILAPAIPHKHQAWSPESLTIAKTEVMAIA